MDRIQELGDYITTNTPRDGESAAQTAARNAPRNPPNPKKLMGDKKPPLHLLPLAGMVHQAMAHFDGDLKYGFENWNETPVEKLTYIGAAMRHLELYKYGETNARDTNVHNLGGVMACCAILLDAELNGNLIDNTRHSKAACDLLHNMEAMVGHLKEMQAAREQEKIDRSWADAAIDPEPALVCCMSCFSEARCRATKTCIRVSVE